MKKVITKEGHIILYNCGGCYSVANTEDKTVKEGLSLDAAFQLFKELTLVAALRLNKMI